ncbi:hypothetical protein GKE82_19835 [Conexibacter sp. W3-3-2]|uniref:hypothetical protein n=1 Tax=Conexibacter sp. W3-3-2 TaxID=2675227 RepID=UPI0012B94A3E|nr:hypothetical protein [Conexibacter sp. W3-3-2]MTD46477.1 hypothetical protein [Conexibacter sp. W3-3-2]
MVRFPALLLLLCLLALGAAPARAAQAPVPGGWPYATLQLGMRDAEGGAGALRDLAPLGLRYHYLSGGANTGSGWTSWTKGDGSFVPAFIADSVDHGMTPVFSLYQLRETRPGRDMEELAGFRANWGSTATMRSWLTDLRLALQRMGSTGARTVLHVEPDLWGYLQRDARDDDPTTVTVAVGRTGLAELRGLPDTAAGLAQAVVRLRDRYARNVLLGYHLSVWGSGDDVTASDSSDARVDELAAKSSTFLRRLGARWDLLFAEFADRDNGYRRVRDGDGGASVWTDADFRRHARFIGHVGAATGLRTVLWQTPLGNSTLDDTPGRYRDNRVEWLLGPGGGERRRQYLDAGVLAILFGKAFPDATCACDDDGDGRPDDGGVFARLARGYVQRGATPLPGATGRPSAAAPVRTSRPRLRIRSAPRVRTVRRGGTLKVDVRVTASSTALTTVVAQLYQPGGRTPLRQHAFRAQRLRGGIARRYVATFRIPRTARTGTWRVKVGVFDPDWQTLWGWQPEGGRVTVR